MTEIAVPPLLVDRRSLLAMAALGLVAGPAGAAVPPDRLPPDSLPLWPGPPPGRFRSSLPEETRVQGSIRHVAEPRLLVHRPVRPTGTAIVVVAGGGYAHVDAGRESGPVCRWLQAQGITAFELIYRLPGEGSRPTAPLEDGQRAMRLVRARAAAGEFGRVGMLGFSTGAHLAGMTAVRPCAAYAAPVDATDGFSARPDFAGLIYPVLSMMPTFDGTRSRRELLGRHPGQAASAAFSVERQVAENTPPVFLAQSADDPMAPIDNSLMMFNALSTAGIPAALNVFPTGGHGWGLGRPGTRPAVWPGLFAAWLRDMAEA